MTPGRSVHEDADPNDKKLRRGLPTRNLCPGCGELIEAVIGAVDNRELLPLKVPLRRQGFTKGNRSLGLYVHTKCALTILRQRGR